MRVVYHNFGTGPLSQAEHADPAANETKDAAAIASGEATNMISQVLNQEDRVLREIKMAISAYSSVVRPSTGATVIYASAPITGGKRLYDALEYFHLKTAEDLRFINQFGSAVLAPNLAAGREHADELRKNFPGPIITPGLFFAQGWLQEHYMSMWRQVIERHVSTVAFAPDWEYSPGCAEEFSIAMHNGLGYMIDGDRPVTRQAAIDSIRAAVDDIDQRGFDAKPLYDVWRQVVLDSEAIAAREAAMEEFR